MSTSATIPAAATPAGIVLPHPEALPDTALYLVRGTSRYAYHLRMWEGTATQDGACFELGVKAATGRQWERRLRVEAARHLGLPTANVSYALALRCVFDWPRVLQERRQVQACHAFIAGRG